MLMGFLFPKETELGDSMLCLQEQGRKSHRADPSFGPVAAFLGGLVQAL